MAKILSIEVGYSLTRICEMDYRTKNPKVYKYASLPTPQGVMNDGYLLDNPEFAADLKSCLAINKMKTKQVVFSVTSSRIATREVTMPAVKRGQMDALVKANAPDYFPIDLTEYELAHLVLGVIKGEDKNDRYRVMVMAAEKKLVEGYDRLAAQCGLHMIAMDYSGNSVYQVMRGECKEGTEMVIKVEEHSTIATIISGQNLVLQRNVVYGVDDAIYTLAKSPAYEESTYEAALEMLKRKTCIKVVLNDSTNMVEEEYDYDESEAVSRAKKEITASLSQLVGNVGRVVDLYNSKNVENPIRKIRLVGLGGDISGLSKLFTNELGISTTVMNNLESVAWNRLDGEGNPGRYIACIGAAFAPVGFINEEKKKSDIKDVNYKNVAILSGIFFVLASAALVVLAMTNYAEARAEQTRLQRLEAEYAPAEAVYNTYNSTLALYEMVQAGYKLTENPNDDLIAFLEELEEKLPADAYLSSITSNTEQAILNLTVGNIEEAAKVIETIRNFDSLMSVSVTGLSIVDEDQEGETEEAAAGDAIESENAESVAAEGTAENSYSAVQGTAIADDSNVTFTITCTYHLSSADDAGDGTGAE